MTSILSNDTKRALQGFSAHFGIPKILVSDNGPILTSSESVKYLTSN